jgi:hypothetical protein
MIETYDPDSRTISVYQELTAEVEQLRGEMEDQGPYINKLRDQNKELRAEVEHVKEVCKTAVEAYEEAAAEVERLTEQNATITAAYEAEVKESEHYADEVERLTKELALHKVSQFSQEQECVCGEPTPGTVHRKDGPCYVQEPVAYYDFQERGFYWANNVVHGPVPVSVKVDPMPLYAAPVTKVEPVAMRFPHSKDFDIVKCGNCNADIRVESNRDKDAVLRMALEEMERVNAVCLREFGIGVVNLNTIAAIKSCTENGEKLTGGAGRAQERG